MTRLVSASRLLTASILALAAFAVSQRGSSAEPIETALTLSPDAPARLVLAYWPSGGWQVRQSGRQVELVLPGAGLAISTGAVGLPAGAGGITSLTTEIDQDATYLRIGLGCDCTLAVQGDGARLLIDVVGAERIAGPVFRESGPAPRLAPVPRSRRTGAADVMRAIEAHRVEETRTRLLEELRSAAEAGLVTLRPDADGMLSQANRPLAGTEVPFQTEPGVVVEGHREGAVTPDGGDGDPGASVAVAAAPEEPVLAGTTAPGQPIGSTPLPASAPVEGDDRAVDSTVTATPAEPAEGTELAAQTGHASFHDLLAVTPAPACFDNGAFRLTDPIPHHGLIAEIARLRRTLLGEFDRADRPSALALAWLYLAHGLGIETLGILADFAPDAPETHLLAALAQLTEGRPLPVPNILSVSGCTGQHALWQAMNAALMADSGKALEHEAAATGALEQMARGLRGQVAAHIGLAAIAEHDWVTAHRLNAMAKRSIAGNDRDGQELRRLLEAKLSIGRGDVAAGLALLTELYSARSPAGAEALLVLAELSTDPASEVPLNETDLRLDKLRLELGVLALAERDTPLGAQAFLGEVALTGRLFGRDAAFELLAYGVAGRVISESAYREALTVVGASLADWQNDTPLAVTYEADPQRFATALDDPGFRLALARSYLGLGAPSLAEALLHPGDIQGDAMLADFARVYLEIGNAEAAGRFALSLPDGPGQARIQAGVALAAGDASAALAALNAAGAPAVERARTAWAARDWQASAQAWAEVVLAGSSDAESDPAETGPAEPGSGEPPEILTANLAARLALAARRAGASAVPPEAASLAATIPDLGSGLEAIFAPLAEDLAEASPTEVAVYLETVSAEVRLFEELL